MFQNLHLASYVNQLQQQQQQNRVGNKLRSSIQSQVQPSTNGRAAKSTGAIGGLPRQATMGDGSQKMVQNGGGYQQLQDGSNDFNQFQFMAVGSRLSMATYTKKESQNPGTMAQPGFANQQQKTLKQRKQQKQEKTNKFLDKLAPNQKRRTSKSLAPFGVTVGANGKQSLNSDLFPLGKVKQSNGSLVVNNKVNRGVSRVPTNESKDSNSPETQQFRRANDQPNRAIRPASLYKTPGSEAQTKEAGSNQESQVLQSHSVAEVTEAPGYLPMNINVTNGVIRGTVFKPARSHVSNEEMLPSGSPSVSQLADPEDIGSIDIPTTEQRVTGKKKVTVNAVQATKKHVSQFHLDQEHWDLNIEDSKDNLATASIVTQNYNLKDINDDYQTTALLTGSKNSSVHVVPHKQLPHINSQKFKVQGVKVPGSGSSPRKQRRSMAMMKESDTTVVGAGGLEFKYASLTSTPPNYDQQQSVTGETKRAQSTMTGKTSQLVRVTRGQSRAEGGVITTMLLPPQELNFGQNRSPSFQSTDQKIDLKKVNILAVQEMIGCNGRGSTPISARDDYKEQSNHPSTAIKLHDDIVDIPININRSANLSSGGRPNANSKESAVFRVNALMINANQTSRGKITSHMSAANFSNLERQQNVALFGITGNTLSQYMTAQNMKGGNWQQQQQLIFSNMNDQQRKKAMSPKQQSQQAQSRQQQEMSQTSTRGMKGGKLAKNSYFRRMQAFQKKRDDMDANCGDCLSYNSNPDDKNILLGVTDQGPYVPLSNRMVLNTKDAFPQRSPTTSFNERAAKRQSITVQQSRPKTQDDYRWKLTTALQDNHSPRDSPKLEADKVVGSNHEPVGAGNHDSAGGLLGNMNLRSWNSSNEQEQLEQIEDFKATVEAGAKENDAEGTIVIVAPQETSAAAGDFVSQSASFNPNPKRKITAEQKIQAGSTQTRSGVIQSYALQEVDFKACVRRESGGLIVHDRNVDSHQTMRDNGTAHLSSTSNRDLVRQSMMKIEVESKKGVNSGILELINSNNDSEYDDPGTKAQKEFDQSGMMKTGVILNFPLPEDLDTIHMKRINSGGSSEGVSGLEYNSAEMAKLQRRPTFSPQMRILQKKDGKPRNSKSQNTAKRRNQQSKPVREDSMVVGTKFKPQIVFKESDLQHLFDSAEQPVQQVIEKVLLDDIDLFDGYGYQSQVRKQQKVKQFKNAFSRHNDHIKYEFIERLLKKPDKEMTRKTLNEMTSLYQELLEKNLSMSSSIALTKNNHMQSIQEQGYSQQSIIVLTDKKGNAVFEPSVRGDSRTKDYINVHDVEFDRTGTITGLKGHRGSMPDDRLKLKFKKGSEAANQTTPLASVSPKKNPSLQSMSEIEYKKDLVTVGKIIQNSSGSNTLFLELGQQKWSSNLEDYGMKFAQKSPSNSPGLEIDGKKRNILKHLNQRTNSNNIVTQMTVQDDESYHNKKVVNSGRFECAAASQRENSSSNDVTSQFSLKQKLTQSKVKVALESARKTAAQTLARNPEEKEAQAAKVLLSHTPNQQNTARGSRDVSLSVTVETFTKRQTVNEMFKNRKFNHTSLSPRIAAIEAKINSKNASQQVKTAEDVQNLVSILGLGIGTNLEVGQINADILQNIDLMQLQTARSAYLTYRANLMNNPNKVIVGNEVRDLNERKRFIEELFHPIVGGQDVKEFQSKLLNLYEQKLASQGSAGNGTGTGGGRTATATTMSNVKQSDSTRRPDYINKSELMISGKEAPLKEQKLRSSSILEANRSALAKRAKVKSNASMRSGNQSPMSPFAASDYKDKMWGGGVGSAQRKDSAGLDKITGSSAAGSKNTGAQKSQGKLTTEQSANIAKYQKKEEQRLATKEVTEKKNVMKHELKVPKAGKLDLVKSSRMRKLSSNQVTGFCLRKVTSNLPTESEGDDSKFFQTQYGMGSNQDLVELLKRPKNKSSNNVFMQGGFEAGEKDEDFLCVNSEDAEEVGTQMMISRKNLQSTVAVAQISVASPKGQQQIKVEKMLISQNSDEDNSVLNNADGDANVKKEKPSVHLVDENGLQKNVATNKALKKANSGDSNAIQKIGTIKVKELYQIGENTNSNLASSIALQSSQKLSNRKQPFASNSKAETKVINLGLLRAQKHKKSQSQTANFERLSGLISESNTDQKKLKLIAHYRRIKEAERISKNNADWKRATPCISHGSTFYKDLFELRNQVRGGTTKDMTTDLNITQALNQTMFEAKSEHGLDDSLELLRQSMIMFNQTQQRPQISNLLRPDPKRGKRLTFSVSKNALTPSSKKLISQLLAQMKGSLKKGELAVQPLKQTCLVQYILEEWSSTLNGQLKQFEHSCTYSDSLRIGGEGGSVTTEAYSVILYGNHTPISNCCKQLICFQFAKSTRQVSVYCLETTCRRSKLDSRSLNAEIFYTTFLTAKANQGKREVIYHKESQSGTKQKVLLVSSQGATAAAAGQKVSPQKSDSLRKNITLASQNARSSRSNSRVLTPPQFQSGIPSPQHTVDALSGKYQHSSKAQREEDWMSGEIKLGDQSSNEAVNNKGIEVTMQLNQNNGKAQREIATGQTQVIKYFQRQQTLLRPSKVSPTNTSDQFSLSELDKGGHL